MSDTALSEDDIAVIETIKVFLEKDIHDKDVAALMGFFDEDNPSILPGGVMSRLGLAPAKLAILRQRQADEDFIDFLLQEIIRQTVARLNTFILDQQKYLEDLLKKLEQAQEAYQTLEDQRSILDEEMRYFQEHGVFNLDEKGALNNPQAEAIISLWEEETGQTIDRTHPESYERLLFIAMQKEQQQADIRNDIQTLTIEYELRKKALDKALTIKDQLESNDPAVVQKALAGFRKLESNLEETIRSISIPERTNHELSTYTSDIPTQPSMSGEESSFSFEFPSLKQSFQKASRDTPSQPIDSPEIKPPFKNKHLVPIHQGI